MATSISKNVSTGTSNNDLLVSLGAAALMCTTSYAVGKWRATNSNQNGSNTTSDRNPKNVSSEESISKQALGKQAQGSETANDDSDGSKEVLQRVLKMISTNWTTTNTPATH